jgi:hypothetical protein
MKLRTYKHNPFVSLLALLLLALITVCILTGCSIRDLVEAEEELPRFELTYQQGLDGGVIEIITDTETGRQYLFVEDYYKGGLALMPEVAAAEPAPAEPEEHPYAEEARYIAKTIWGEARGCSPTEQAAVAWCILNRVDSEDPYYPDDIIGVVTQEDQFDGYDPGNPLDDGHFYIALETIDLWLKEDGKGIVAGRVLPREYLWFAGDGNKNTFRDAYAGPCNYWDWSLASPYGAVDI